MGATHSKALSAIASADSAPGGDTLGVIEIIGIEPGQDAIFYGTPQQVDFGASWSPDLHIL
jgi:hypothetical protein